MKKHRRKHTAEFKARIAREAIRGIDSINEIAAKYEVHPVQVGNWKKELLDRVPEYSKTNKNPAIINDNRV